MRGVGTVRFAASTVVTPAGLLEPGQIEVENGLITSVGPASGPVPDRIIAPGFVDLQVNGHDDVNCTTAEGADWERMDRLLLAQGVTTWCPTLVTMPLEGFAAPLERITAAASRPAAARPHIAGAHLEGPFLGGAPGAHNRSNIRDLDLDWLAALPPIVRVVTLAAEQPLAVRAIELLTRRGVLVSLGHSTASYEQALAGADAGARLVTHLFNGMGALHHRQPGLVGATLSDARLTPSVIADGIHVHPAVIGVAFRAKGPGHIVLVTDAVAWRAGELTPGSSGQPSRIQLREGAPRLADGTIAGSALAMNDAIRRVVEEAGVPLAEAVLAASTTPARLLGLEDRGRIEPGARADLAVLDRDFGLIHTVVGGEVVDGH